MRAVLLIAHGSRRESANQEVHTLADKLQSALNPPTGLSNTNDRVTVSTCFLELAQPCINTGLSLLSAAGAQSIQVLPYFLTQGRHVNEDIPKIINHYIEQQPDTSDVKIEILPHLGADNILLNVMVEILQNKKYSKPETRTS